MKQGVVPSLDYLSQSLEERWLHHRRRKWISVADGTDPASDNFNRFNHRRRTRGVDGVCELQVRDELCSSTRNDIRSLQIFTGTRRGDVLNPRPT
jgi:hypothetical protein